MGEHWREVGAAEAQELANQGKLAIAGLPGKPGQTAVVVPGHMQEAGEGRRYPKVQGGSSGGIGSGGYSVGNKNAGVWSKTERALVKYYTPK